ncbi:MAG: hotdog fold thioesterase [Gammaproteobacteria bacterium]|nr:hotdog fold thioesterase [Gammaproteobacteria bacterium]
MSLYIPKDVSYREKVSESFSRQEVMKTIGVSIVSIELGQVELVFKHDTKLTQQHGFIHAGIITTVLDSACGYAAFSLMPEDSSVLTIEFKTNLLSPAMGEKYLAVGRVKKPGKTITVCDGELFAFLDDQKKLIATMTCTLMTLSNKERGIKG